MAPYSIRRLSVRPIMWFSMRGLVVVKQCFPVWRQHGSAFARRFQFACLLTVLFVACQTRCLFVFPGRNALRFVYTHARSLFALSKPGAPDRVPMGVRFLVSRCCYSIYGLLGPNHMPQSPEHVVFTTQTRKQISCWPTFWCVPFRFPVGLPPRMQSSPGTPRRAAPSAAA